MRYLLLCLGGIMASKSAKMSESGKFYGRFDPKGIKIDTSKVMLRNGGKVSRLLQ